MVDEANDMLRALASASLKLEVEFVWDIYNSNPQEVVLLRLLEFTSPTQSFVRCYWSYWEFLQRAQRMRESHEARTFETTES